VNSGSEHGSPEDTVWAAWLEKHGPALLLFARQQSRSEADAQDLLQEAMVESWRNQPPASAPPVSIVFRILRHRAIDRARRDDRRAAREISGEETPAQFWFDSNAEDRERDLLIQKAMTQLPDIYREVLTLKIWAGLTLSEIAETVGVPPNTAASRYRYALKEMAKLMKEVCQ